MTMPFKVIALALIIFSATTISFIGGVLAVADAHPQTQQSFAQNGSSAASSCGSGLGASTSESEGFTSPLQAQ